MSRASVSVVFAALALPVAVAGCPQFLGDWTLSGGAGSDDGGGDSTMQDAGSGGDGRTEGGGGDGSMTDAADSGPIEAAVGTEASTDTGLVSADAAPDACTPVTHNNGVGQTWTDCVPLGTYNEAQAMRACAAAGGGTSCSAALTCAANPNIVVVCGAGFCWVYGGIVAGAVGLAGWCLESISCPTTGIFPTWN